jgi:hypothetical protein
MRARSRKKLPRPTDRLKLGDTGLKVSPLCIGMTSSPDTIPAAFDAGINFFFLTADLHWGYYEYTRMGLRQLLARGRKVRDQIVVCAATYMTHPYFCDVPFVEVLEFLPELERLDMVVAGAAYWQDFWGRLPTFQHHRQEGRFGARAIGASFHDRALALTAANHSLVDLAFIRYNAGHPGAREDLLPHLAQGRQTRIFNFKSTMGHVPEEQFAALGLPPGSWQPTVTDHYRFALSRPQMDGVLCSPASPEEVHALVDALAQGPLDAEQEDYLVRLTAAAGGTVPEG